MFWYENRLLLKENLFKEHDILKFKYIIRNFDEDISFLNKNYNLKSLEKNEIDEKPGIVQENKNEYKITLPSVNKKLEYLEGLFKLYFTNTMNIPLEISGNIKKNEFKVFFYDPIWNKAEENNKPYIYIFKHQYKKNKRFDIEIIFRVQLFDDEEHTLELTLPWTNYPDTYIQFSLKGSKPSVTNKLGKFREGKTISITASFPEGYKDNNLNIFKFTIDNNYNNGKSLNVQIRKEMNLNDNKKFYYFPYKTFINGSYNVINQSVPKDFFLQKTPIVFYSPYSIKFWKFVPDIIIKPGEDKYGFFVDEFKFIIFVREFDNYWVTNCKEFGDEESINSYEKLELKIENIQEASKRISFIFNNIIGKKKLFKSKYKYNEIKNLKVNELNKNGYFLEFIYWLVSDKISTEYKYKQLNKLFKEMGDDYYNTLSKLLVDISVIDRLNKANNENKKKKRKNK